MIKHCRKSVLYNKSEPGRKRTQTVVSMGQWEAEGVEICELVEIYLLSLVANIIDKNNSGLYFHDRLNLSRNAN